METRFQKSEYFMMFPAIVQMENAVMTMPTFFCRLNIATGRPREYTRGLGRFNDSVYCREFAVHAVNRGHFVVSDIALGRSVHEFEQPPDVLSGIVATGVAPPIPNLRTSFEALVWFASEWAVFFRGFGVVQFFARESPSLMLLDTREFRTGL
ncbi:MAG TPA: hypothetical protein VJ248_09690, partial [Candidatus Udaeobacter sp.]|nr:hypothetical protein [Candidatus Udaeobacter sp.]